MPSPTADPHGRRPGGAHARRSHRRGKKPVIVGAAVIAVVIVAAAWWGLAHRDDSTSARVAAGAHPPTGHRRATPEGSAARHARSTPKPSVESDSTMPAATSPATTTATPRPVTSKTIQIVDSTRPVVSHGQQIAGVRRLPTTVWIPTGSDRVPLVVFARGFELGPSHYVRFCSTLAAAGFAVAAPSFPLADEARGNSLDRADIPTEAGDVSFVIDTLTKGDLAPRIATGAYAVVSHSDGADVALLDGYGQGHVDRRLRAVVSDAPDAMTDGVVASGIPLLLIQGNADSVVPYWNSQKVFTQVTAPTAYLTLTGADHFPPIAGGTKWTPTLDASVAAFLHAAVTGRPSTQRSSAAIDAVASLVQPGDPATLQRH